VRLALSQFCLPGLSTREFLDVAARAGAEGCELGVFGGPAPSDDPRTIVAAARRSPVPVASVNALRDWALPDDGDYHEAFEVLLEVAVETGAPAIVCVAPIRYGELPPRRTVLDSAANRLAALAELASPVHVRLALEQVGRSSTLIGARSGIASLADALAVVESAGQSVGLTLDSYNLATAGVSLEEVARLPSERIALGHVADGSATGSPRGLPGEGELPLAAYVAALVDTGFDGFLSIETFPQQAPSDPLEFARRGLAALRALLPA
jgi:sugar phosphate isomerase/epimerase